MIEVEIKLPIKSRECVEAELQKLGFSSGNFMRESDIYFNSDNYDLRQKDMALRIRSCENLTTGESDAVMTYKGPKLDSISMTRKELETEVEDAKVCQEILKGIGFTKVYPVCKLRQYYHMEQITACVDEVEGLGEFLELEIIVAGEEEREEALERLEEILTKLGYGMEETTRSSYLSILQRKKRKSII
ncbi:MAG: class IV adenylate cyclase [Schaedlerella sp.]|nr:class IV adenylate cyclase [Schaedlerella sp.]